MINRIRDIRREMGLTLADVAARCSPPTTAQTVGRLETGMRTLSLGWMNRIAAALDVAPELLVRGETVDVAHVVARFTESGAEPLSAPREAVSPGAIVGSDAKLVLAIEASAGDYRAGDQVWLRRVESADYPRQLNRDVLAPRSGGRFAFGRMIDREGNRVALLPPGAGQRQVIIDNPPWLGVAALLVRPL